MNTILSGLTLLQAAPAANTGSGGMIQTLLIFGAVFLIFWLLIIRPQNKKQKETQKMIEAVKKGDKVVTVGGVHATVSTVKEKTVILKVDDNTKMEFSKSSIASVEAKADEKPAEDPKAEGQDSKGAEEKK